MVATGTTTTRTRLGIPGEDLPHVSHYFDEPHAYYRKRVVVVGGKNSAANAALALFRAGAFVTLVHRRERLSGSIKYWIKPDIENRIEEEPSPRASDRGRADPAGLGRDRGAEGREEIPADAVFLLTGYHPDTVSCERAGVQHRRGDAPAGARPETLETNVPGLFVAGASSPAREAAASSSRTAASTATTW